MSARTKTHNLAFVFDPMRKLTRYLFLLLWRYHTREQTVSECYLRICRFMREKNCCSGKPQDIRHVKESTVVEIDAFFDATREHELFQLHFAHKVFESAQPHLQNIYI